MMKYTIIRTDPIDGFRCLGLFSSEDSAVDFGINEFGYGESWRVMPIHPIKTLPDVTPKDWPPIGAP